MSGAFRLLGLLVAVAVVALIAKRQMQAVATPPAAAPASASAGVAGGAPQQVKQDVERALQQGAARTAEAASGAE